MSLIDLRKKVDNKWIVPFAGLIFLILIADAHPSVWGGAYSVLFLLLNFCAFALYVVFGGFRGGKEEKLLIAYGIWLLISRMLNGDYFLSQDTVTTLCICVSFVLLALGAVLSREKRFRFLDCGSAVLCAVNTLIAGISLYSALTVRNVVNPINGQLLCNAADAVNRLELFGRNPNYVAVYFFISLVLLLYQFFRYKKLPVRIVLAAAFLLNYLALTLTFSRNVMLGFALCFGAFMVMLAFEYLPLHKKSHKAGVLLLLMLICVPIGYKSFDVSAKLVGIVSEWVRPEENPAISVQSGAAPEAESSNTAYEDSRGFADSGRLPIWKSAIPVIKADPTRLLTGRVDVMDGSNKYFYEQFYEYGNKEYGKFASQGAVHYHNSFLHLLMQTGLPGLLLVLAFMVLLAVHMIRIFFSEKGKAPLEARILVIMLAGILAYNMLETALFYNLSLSSIVFFVVAGFVISESKELKSN